MFFIGPSGMKFVSAGDLAAAAFDKTDFTADGAWHDLDVSAHVPVGIPVALWRLNIKCATAGFTAQIRPKGYTNDINIIDLMVTVANKSNYETFAMVVPADGMLQYKIADTTWATINLTPVGWFV